MLRWAIHATVLTLILAAAEGCGNSSNSAAPDASPGQDASSDAPSEVSADAGEAGPDCGSTPPTGTQLVAATDPLVVLTMTGDDHAIYEDLSTQELYGVAVSGGVPSDIGKMTSQGGTVRAHGSALLYLPAAADPDTSVGPLSSWTASGGTSVISTTAVAVDTYYFTYDASKDGKYVAYFATTDGGLTATLTVSTIDGKTQTPLVTKVDLNNQNCFPPEVQFADDTIIAQYCVPPGADAGTSTEGTTIAAFTAPFTTQVTLGSSSQPPQVPLTIDPTATFALLSGPSGTGLSLAPLAGGTPTTVDAKGAAGLFTPAGDVLYYTTTAGALLRYTVSSAASTTLVTSGVAFPVALSPDGNWLQTGLSQDPSSGLTDLYIVSTTTPGPATQVVKTATTDPFGFTVDSQFSLFGTNFPSDFGAVTYSLEASKTSGGAPAKVLSAAAGPILTTGAKLVINTNQSKSTGAADIVALDSSSTAGPTTLVTQADPNLFVASTKDVVYSWYCDENTTAGIWKLTPP